MDAYEIKLIYNQKGKGREAALEAYPQALADCAGDEQERGKLAFLAADFAHTEALSLLFDAGVSPAITNRYAFTLLHHLAREEESRRCGKPAGAVAAAAEFLLDHKVSYLRKDENENMTCYHYAARNALVEFVEVLAKRGAKLNMTDRDGNTAIHIACEYARQALIGADLDKKRLDRAIKDREEAIAQVKERNMMPEESLRYISSLAPNPPEEVKAEYEAALQKVEDYFRVVKAFAEGGVDIDEKNNFGRRALDVAVENNAKKIAAFLSGTLLDEGDSAAAIAAGGMTLHKAAEKGDVEAIKALAASGADLNALGDESARYHAGLTPLAVACAVPKPDAVDALLAAGASPAFMDGHGRVAPAYFFVSTRFPGSIGSMRGGELARIIRAMLAAGFDINQNVDDDSNTLLILACAVNNYLKEEVIAELLRHNPDLNKTNRRGETALMHASAKDFDIMENVQITFLEQGADVAARDQNGDTALHYAARNSDHAGAKSLSDMLLEFDADAQAVNNAGKTALDIATEQDNEPLVKLLLAKM